jgi:hypothetical protein
MVIVSNRNSEPFFPCGEPSSANIFATRMIFFSQPPISVQSGAPSDRLYKNHPLDPYLLSLCLGFCRAFTGSHSLFPSTR